MAAEEVVGAYASALFIRSEAEIRRPVVLLSGERTNVYGVLEKHFRETALPPSERFWRAVRSQWTPALETWRPRVNGVQLKVGACMQGEGARRTARAWRHHTRASHPRLLLPASPASLTHTHPHPPPMLPPTTGAVRRAAAGERGGVGCAALRARVCAPAPAQVWAGEGAEHGAGAAAGTDLWLPRPSHPGSVLTPTCMHLPRLLPPPTRPCSDTSVDRLAAELRDFVGMVVAW